jgi:hypothetical protein
MRLERNPFELLKANRYSVPNFRELSGSRSLCNEKELRNVLAKLCFVYNSKSLLWMLVLVNEKVHRPQTQDFLVTKRLFLNGSFSGLSK